MGRLGRAGRCALPAVVVMLAACSPPAATQPGAVATAVAAAAVQAGSGDRGPHVCDHPESGPDQPPVGAITIDPIMPGELGTKTAAAPPGSTFWLAPGRHSLGPGAYAQVIPKDNDTFVGAPGAVLDGDGVNNYAFTGKAVDVYITHLTVQGFRAPRDEGVVNHDSADGWVIAHDVIQGNSGAGVMGGAQEQVRDSCLRDNGQYGLNAYQSGDHITGLVVDDDEITGNDVDAWEARVPGCGCTGGAKFWAVNGADVQHNWIHANRGPGLWADTDNNDFLISDNVITDNDSAAVIYETSYNLTLRDNDIEHNNLVNGRTYAARGDGFPVAAVYLSESGGEQGIPARTDLIDVHDNNFRDNWGGVTAWENPDRFCNSPANTSTGYCTRLVPDANLCAQPAIAVQPLYDRCRWRTQQVSVHDNVFVVDGPLRCAAAARNGLLSGFGTYPDWSPYKGKVIEDAITFGQDDVWHDNTYRGPWQFVVHSADQVVPPQVWQAAPYNQDSGSTFGDWGKPDAC